MECVIKMTRDEIKDTINYDLICTTMDSSIWNTCRRRRKFSEEFTRNEQKRISELKSKAYNWYCGKGVPEKVSMSLSTYRLWIRLEEFCASLF